MSGSLEHACGCLAGMSGCVLSSHERFIASTVDFVTERLFRLQQSACRPVSEHVIPPSFAQGCGPEREFQCSTLESLS